MRTKLKVCAVNFWPGFSLQAGFVRYLLERAIGEFDVAADEKSADIVLSSVFPRFQRLLAIHPKLKLKTPKFPEKTIGVLWENMRPNYSQYAYSISSDFDSYGGRNVRIPLWYGQLNWPGFNRGAPSDWHGYEPLIEIESLLSPRPACKPGEHELFCCFVAANPELHRMLAVEALSRVEQVDLYGPITGKAYKGSKYDLLKRYRFNLCFENSAFPGYFTEKLLHSWAGGCIPLYYSGPGFERDFNPSAVINRKDFATLDEFAEHVAKIHRSPDLWGAIYAEPLLTQAPSLSSATDFLREACDSIMNRKVAL